MSENNDPINFDSNGKRITGYPTNKKEWWDLVDHHWDNLLAIVFHHIDCFAKTYKDPGNNQSKLTGRNIVEEMTYLKNQQNEKLESYLSEAWFMASDAYAWSVPSWGILCDLLSEFPPIFGEQPEE